MSFLGVPMPQWTKALEMRIPGPPFGKQRPKFGGRRVYTPAATVKEELRIKELAREMLAASDSRPISGPLRVVLTLWYPIPASMSKKRRQDALNGLLLPEVKPDVDNVSKLFLDACNAILYADDKSVCSLTVEKFYGEDPGIDATLYTRETHGPRTQ